MNGNKRTRENPASRPPLERVVRLTPLALFAIASFRRWLVVGMLTVALARLPRMCFPIPLVLYAEVCLTLHISGPRRRHSSKHENSAVAAPLHVVVRLTPLAPVAIASLRRSFIVPVCRHCVTGIAPSVISDSLSSLRSSLPNAHV